VNYITSFTSQLKVSKVSEERICNKKHHLWLAKRLAYIGMGNYREVFFNVWAHATDFEGVQNDTICRRTQRGFVPIGSWDECMLDPIRRVQRRPKRKMSDIWYPSIQRQGGA